MLDKIRDKVCAATYLIEKYINSADIGSPNCCQGEEAVLPRASVDNSFVCGE